MPNAEISLSAVAVLFAVLFALFYRPRPRGAVAPSSSPAPVAPVAPVVPVAPPPAYAPPANPLTVFTQGGDPYMIAEIQRGIGLHNAQKWAADMSEALSKITGPATPKS